MKRTSKPRTTRALKKRKPSERVPRNSISAWGQPFKSRMRYHDAIILQSSGGNPLPFHTFRCNNLFDPDLTGTGHQPLRYDQLSVLFAAYRVRSAMLKVTFAHPNVAPTSTTTGLGPWQVAITKSKTNATLPGVGSDFQTACEMEGSVNSLLTVDETKTLYSTYNYREAGYNNIEEVNTGTGTSTTFFHWIISCFNIGNVATTNVVANIDIEFEVEWIEPRTIATS